jgi:hypothetical protein
LHAARCLRLIFLVALWQLAPAQTAARRRPWVPEIEIELSAIWLGFTLECAPGPFAAGGIKAAAYGAEIRRIARWLNICGSFSRVAGL